MEVVVRKKGGGEAILTAPFGGKLWKVKLEINDGINKKNNHALMVATRSTANIKKIEEGDGEPVEEKTKLNKRKEKRKLTENKNPYSLKITQQMLEALVRGSKKEGKHLWNKFLNSRKILSKFIFS